WLGWRRRPRGKQSSRDRSYSSLYDKSTLRVSSSLSSKSFTISPPRLSEDCPQMNFDSTKCLSDSSMLLLSPQSQPLLCSPQSPHSFQSCLQINFDSTSHSSSSSVSSHSLHSSQSQHPLYS